MVLGLLFISAIPTVIGVGEAISAQKKQNEAQKEKVKFALGITLTIDGVEEEATGVLTDGKLYVDHSACPVKGFKFSGWYFMYPGEEQLMGLVSMTNDNPPALGWIFVDADTRAVRYGSRKDTVGHVVGPWHWTPNEKFLTLRGGGEGFVAVKEEQGEGEEQGEEHKGDEKDKKDKKDEKEGGGAEAGEAGEEAARARWVIHWDPDGVLREQLGDERCVSVTLRRQLALGVDSRYVRD
ncbi:hypothetical protein SODALDRAFT_326753 [Sodiomyces alkalinus F11]|uniref:Uncharacterized protein n=1 Tax=Sodiomyces alkalinus (strain CBS 110278 / VKM F-3762 / F11) TaxID=1314773 RepID=A0A3N2Q7D7_SODAK|nr:hypothetical protein SODALDRAFT_326753 [Sodiomyces alkalinus F11]ROT42597.1 hypothetical protein SODALDRAFT_326753 [Sodiomyces alkalinus F11]